MYIKKTKQEIISYVEKGLHGAEKIGTTIVVNYLDVNEGRSAYTYVTIINPNYFDLKLFVYRNTELFKVEGVCYIYEINYMKKLFED
ncbi:MAG: hypothetical protein RBQ97_03660 [Acholeplasma sp.]|nr:hypothetical protein [Acholeplasma sp.]